MLVLIHHSVIAYTYFGHTDQQSFLGFDCVVLFNDSFFMAAMFFLSGLFVWPSLQRKGISWFLRDRWWRLGLPFIVCAVLLMPFAYWAIELELHDPNTTFAAFWWRTVTVGPWNSGPAWFVWVLLALDVIAALVYYALSRLGRGDRQTIAGEFWAARAVLLGAADRIHRRLRAGRALFRRIALVRARTDRDPGEPHPALSALLLRRLRHRRRQLRPRPAGRRRRDGAALAGLAWCRRLVSYGCIIALIYIKHAVLPDVNVQPLWWQVAYALAFVTYSAAQTFNILALFLRFDNEGSSVLDPLRESAYGIYLIHYVPVLWLQYLMFGMTFGPVDQITAIIKAVIVFVLTLASSWAVDGGAPQDSGRNPRPVICKAGWHQICIIRSQGETSGTMV